MKQDTDQNSYMTIFFANRFLFSVKALLHKLLMHITTHYHPRLMVRDVYDKSDNSNGNNVASLFYANIECKRFHHLIITLNESSSTHN